MVPCDSLIIEGKGVGNGREGGNPMGTAGIPISSS